MPALPLDEAGKYVAGAYVVFLAVLVIYVGIMAVKLRRIEEQMREVRERRRRESSDDAEPVASGTGASDREEAG